MDFRFNEILYLDRRGSNASYRIRNPSEYLYVWLTLPYTIYADGLGYF